MNIASLLFIQGYLSTYIIIEQIDKIRVAQRDKILTNTNIKKHFFWNFLTREATILR